MTYLALIQVSRRLANAKKIDTVSCILDNHRWWHGDRHGKWQRIWRRHDVFPGPRRLCGLEWLVAPRLQSAHVHRLHRLVHDRVWISFCGGLLAIALKRHDIVERAARVEAA